MSLSKILFNEKMEYLAQHFKKPKLLFHPLQEYYKPIAAVSNETFSVAIKYCIEKYEYFPKVPELVEAIKIVSRIQKPRFKDSNPKACGLYGCRDGLVFKNIKKGKQVYEYVFRCSNPNCDAAQYAATKYNYPLDDYTSMAQNHKTPKK